MNPPPNYYIMAGHEPTLTSRVEAVINALHALGSDFPSSRSRLLQGLNGMEQMHGDKMAWTARPPQPNAPQAMPDSLQDSTRSIRVHQAVDKVNHTLPHAQSAYNGSPRTQTVAGSIAPHQLSTRAASNLNAVGLFSPGTPTGTSQHPRGRYPDRGPQSQAMQPPTSHGCRQGPTHEHAGSYLYQTSAQEARNLTSSSDRFAPGYPVTASAIGPAHDALDHSSQSQSVTSSETWQSMPSYAEAASYPTEATFSPRDQYSGTPQHYAAANGTRATRPSTSSTHSTNTTTASGRYLCQSTGCKMEFGIRQDYINHMNAHSEIKLQCTFPGCTLSYGAKKSLDRHIQNDHYICQKCRPRRRFNTRGELQTHKATDHRQTILCKGCPASFGTPHELNLHKAAVHRDGKSCAVLGCDRIFASTGKRQKHWENDHPEDMTPTFSCGVCHKSFWDARQRRQHVCRVQSPRSPMQQEY